MPPSLRKACHACTKSKRRCLPRLPSCDRCAKKQIPCVYDLEPITQPEAVSEGQQDAGWSGSRGAGEADQDEDFKIIYHSVRSAREASMIALANGHSSDSAATHPKMLGTAQLTAYVLNFFSNVVSEASMGRGTPFVHVHILQSRLEEDRQSAKMKSFHRLTQIHNLTIQSLTSLLNKTANKSDTELDNLVTRTFCSTHDLWLSPPRHFDSSFNPWEAWLVAESIRRSMFAAMMVRGLLSFVRSGYATYEPFFESFPFDPRAGLWEATSTEQWESRLAQHGGDHVKLKSYHEFIEGAGTQLDPNEDGVFQRLLFLCYHCDAGIQYLQELGDLKY